MAEYCVWANAPRNPQSFTPKIENPFLPVGIHHALYIPLCPSSLRSTRVEYIENSAKCEIYQAATVLVVASPTQQPATFQYVSVLDGFLAPRSALHYRQPVYIEIVCYIITLLARLNVCGCVAVVIHCTSRHLPCMFHTQTERVAKSIHTNIHTHVAYFVCRHTVSPEYIP